MQPNLSSHTLFKGHKESPKLYKERTGVSYAIVSAQVDTDKSNQLCPRKNIHLCVSARE